jgi:hypothetical protein
MRPQGAKAAHDKDFIAGLEALHHPKARFSATLRASEVERDFS